MTKKLCELSPLLKNNQDKYIYIGDTDVINNQAIDLFLKCVGCEIYIKGFATSYKKLINTKILNKKVYDISLLNESDIVFSGSSEFEISDRKINPALIVDRNLLNKKVYVYGAGLYGKKTFAFLNSHGIFVETFIDADIKKHDNPFCGTNVCGPEILNELDENSAIIIAVKNYENIESYIYDHNNSSEIYLPNQLLLSEKIIDEATMGFDSTVRFLCELIKNQRIFIWREDDASNAWVKLYELMDFNVAGFLSDDINEIGTMIMDLPVYAVDDIVYEENYFVIIDSVRIDSNEVTSRCQRLENLGLVLSADFQVSDPFYANKWYINQNVIDFNLGWTFKEKGNLPGIIHYGSNDADSFKIATLGGSTTDGSIFAFKSWPEFLGEKLKNTSIYNCAVQSYTTPQMIIKFIRDILNLNPDMVILYVGNTDIIVKRTETPFVFPYLTTIFDYSYKNIPDEGKYRRVHRMFGNKDSESAVFKGIPSDRTCFEDMMLNLNIINVLCEYFGISNHTFIQPTLFGKQNKEPNEEGLFICEKYFIGEEISQRLCEFRKEIADEIQFESKGWLHDLSAIFDEVNDVYMDHCHVYEEGNKIIADEIWKRIEKDIPQQYKV